MYANFRVNKDVQKHIALHRTRVNIMQMYKNKLQIIREKIADMPRKDEVLLLPHTNIAGNLYRTSLFNCDVLLVWMAV